MRNQQQPVIVKKSRRSHDDHGGSGGAWKVAFADFTMAMMALFLILWLLSVTDEEERKVVSSSLRNYSIFDASSDNPFELSNRPHLIEMENRSSLVEAIATELLARSRHDTVDSTPTYITPTPTIPLENGEQIDLNSFFETPFETMTSLKMLGDIISEMGRQL